MVRLSVPRDLTQTTAPTTLLQTIAQQWRQRRKMGLNRRPVTGNGTNQKLGKTEMV